MGKVLAEFHFEILIRFNSAYESENDVKIYRNSSFVSSYLELSNERRNRLKHLNSRSVDCILILVERDNKEML